MGLELKKGDQVIFLVDRSGLMATADVEGDTRYNAVRESLKAFARGAAKFDQDGVFVHFFNNRVELHEDVSTVEQVDALIDSHKTGTFVLVFTDGEPSDPEAVKKVIVDITLAVADPGEFRILFLTVGERSPELQRWLEDLDSNLPGAKYDIVGVENLAGLDFEQAVADAVNSTATAADAGAGYVGKKTDAA